MKRWLLKRTKINTAEMAKELGIRQATATVLANRELYSRKEARDFLYGGEEAFGDPAEMKDMLQGVTLIAQAIREGKKIAVYGDYDVDGVMSTSILYQTILRCGGQAVFYLPFPGPRIKNKQQLLFHFYFQSSSRISSASAANLRSL